MTFTLDDALPLERTADDVYASHTDMRYWNMIGPYGGWMAALMLKAVLADTDDTAFEPVAMTVDFMKAPGEGAITLRRHCDRAGRTAAFWRVDLDAADGTPCARAIVTLAPHRPTLDFSKRKMPEVPSAEEAEESVRKMIPVKWANLYDGRVIKGKIGAASGETHSLEWIREADRRPLDFISMAALCDTPFPRLFMATGQPSRISTITMTSYFHASAAELEEIGDAYVLSESDCERAVGGFFDQHTKFFSGTGHLLATSHQMVWYDRES
jgi:acyl-CoA thioesterase